MEIFIDIQMMVFHKIMSAEEKKSIETHAIASICAMFASSVYMVCWKTILKYVTY